MILIYKILKPAASQELSMTFSINAWLDRVDPFIELRNSKTGEIMAQFAGEQLKS